MKKLLLLLLIFVFNSLHSQTIPFQYLDPVPGANYVNKETCIIIKPYFTPARGLSADNNVISVIASKSGVHKGRINYSADGKAVIFKTYGNFQLGDTVFVKIGTMLTNNRKSYNYFFLIKSQQPEIYNVNASLETRLAKYFAQNRPVLKDNILSGDSLPSDFPPVTIDVSTSPSQGYIFLDNYAGAYGPYLMILDNTGVPVYYLKTQYTSFDFKVQPNGLLTYYSYNGQQFYGLNGYMQIVDSFYTGNGYYADVHEIRVLDDNSAYMLSYDNEIVDMSKIVTGGDTAAIVTGLIVQQIDSAKNVIFQWRSWDHFQITDATHENLLAHSIDYVHGNAIEVDNDGNIIISSRNMDEVTKIDRSKGDIIWRLGGKHNQFTFINDTIGFSHQHAIRRITNNDITLFDNGNYHTPSFSRAVEYALNEQSKTATLVWQYRNNPGIYSSFMGYVQRLENGNTFIGWGGATPTTTEVTESGSKIFELTFPTGVYSYRGYRFNWAPNAPILRYPSDGETNISLNPKLFWFKYPGALSYHLQVSPDSLFNTLILDTNNLTATNFIIKPGVLYPNLNYYWRVYSNLSSGITPWSLTRDFTTVQNLSANLKLYLEGFWNGTSHVQDTIHVYLASPTSPYTLLDSSIVILSSTGITNPAFDRVSSGSYYLVVKHRNHLETWSKTPQSFFSGSSVNYDFTTAADKAYGDNMKKVGNVWVFYGGDANQDGSIDANDISIFTAQFGLTGSYLSCDFNGDGSVDGNDVQIITANYGLTKAAPAMSIKNMIINKTEKTKVNKQTLHTDKQDIKSAK